MQTLLLGPRLEALATATGCLSPRQVRLVGGMLAEIDRLDRRKTALAASRDSLDPEGELSRWQCALRLEQALVRFDAVSRRRIESGYRTPTRLEIALLAMLDCGGPTSVSYTI